MLDYKKLKYLVKFNQLIYIYIYSFMKKIIIFKTKISK